ncbi:hypothetical protein ACI6Q2_07925 [Chitinophagaceae bacterium LWZ2-11]
MKTPKLVAVELYAVIKNGNYSFLKMNRIIRQYNYEIDTLALDKFERKYRELFGLNAFTDEAQNYPIPLIEQNGQSSFINITEEFYHALSLNYPGSKTLLETGYITFLKRKRSLLMQKESDRVNAGIVIQDIEKLGHFTERLESCLRLTRYDAFVFDLYFAYIPKEKKVLPFRPNDYPGTVNDDDMEFIAKDNYLINVLLNNDKKLSDYISLALQNFEESFHIRNHKLRFVQLLVCLDICFSNTLHEPAEHILARHTSILLAGNKTEFQKCYNEVIELFNLKKDILYGHVSNPIESSEKKDELHKIIVRTENLIRNILKKIIRMNVPTKEKLFYELNVKALPY